MNSHEEIGPDVGHNSGPELDDDENGGEPPQGDPTLIALLGAGTVGFIQSMG
jgi:hypothetical protein